MPDVSAVCCVLLRGLPLSARLSGWASFVLRPPRSLGMPSADCCRAPDGFAADPAVGAGHLSACDVGADGERRDVEEAVDVACCPPVGWERLCHAAQITALTLLVAAGAFGPDDGDRHAALARFGHHVGVPPYPRAGLPSQTANSRSAHAEHRAAGLHVRLLGRFNAVEAVYLGGLGQQRVVGAVGGIGKPIAVPSGRDDDFELPAQAAELPSVGQTEAQRDRSRTPFRGEDFVPLNRGLVHLVGRSHGR